MLRAESNKEGKHKKKKKQFHMHVGEIHRFNVKRNLSRPFDEEHCYVIKKETKS